MNNDRNLPFKQNVSKIHPFVLKAFLHQSRAITLLFMNEFSPFAIPNHSFPISMSMQSLKEIDQNLLKLESGNEARTDRHSNGSEGITLATFLWRGIETNL